jgi:membrane associated rhomboid family serine protease
VTETGTYPVCAFHPDRRAGVVCQRCDKPICPTCMNQASVGFHCPDCVRHGKQKVVHGRAAFGGLTTHTSTLTLILIGVNVLIFLVQATRPDDPLFRLNEVLFDFGLNGPFIAENGEWYRLFTSAFLHWNILHLALNMFALWNLGPIVERSLGRARFGVIYAVSLVAGSAGAALMDPLAFTAGASGAIYGLLGALVVLFRDRGISIMQSGLGLTLLINFVFTIGYPGISIGGHLGGLVGGLASTWILVEGSRRLRNPQLALLLAASLILAFFAFGLWAATTWTDPIF